MPASSEYTDFLDRIVSMAEPVELHFRWRPRLSDPNDELVLDAAVNGQAGDALPILHLPTTPLPR